MKNLGKLLIPLGLGALAFVLNWLAVQPQLGREFVTVNEDVAVDKPLDESQLTSFKIVGADFDRMKQTLVPWEERAAILNLPIRRELRNGDFVFWQDVRYLSADFLAGPDEMPLHVSLEGVDYEPSLLKVGNLLSLIVPANEAPKPVDPSDPANVPVDLNMRFEEIGPFRILSVGARTLEAPTEADAEATDRGNTNFVTLAVKLDPGMKKPTDETSGGVRAIPEAARRLLAAKNARATEGKNFVGLVLYQDEGKLQRLREAINAKATEAEKKSEKPDETKPAADDKQKPTDAAK
ncbi:MAG: hypothetical protein JNK76_26110 [Planctomycetales bacterium]|nr:hypothetical protein [Planctomycetales bacterium]MBN8626497.1 hypothetical protein [Planctomycetota bacterium]